MTLKSFCRTLIGGGWSRYQDCGTIYLSRGRFGLTLEQDYDGDWYIVESGDYLQSIDSIYFKSNRIILYFWDGGTRQIWL